MLGTMMKTSPVVSVMLVAIVVPAACIGIGLLFGRTMGWVAASPARHRRLVVLVAGVYAVLAAIAVAFDGLGPESWLYVALAIVWSAGACWYVFGPRRQTG